MSAAAMALTREGIMKSKFTRLVAVSAISTVLLAGTASATDVSATTSLSIKASKTSVSSGATVTLSGNLKSSVIACEKKKIIQVIRKGGGVVGTVKTNDKGHYSLKIHPTKTAKYKAKFAGSASGVHPNTTVCFASSSGFVTVKVH
jgi:hypothetical protein